MTVKDEHVNINQLGKINREAEVLKKILALVVLCSISLFAAEKYTRSKKISYDTKSGWYNTGIMLKENQKIKVVAEGEWFPSVKKRIETDADGIRRRDWDSYSITSDFSHGRLIAYIAGKETERKYYELGKKDYLKAKSSGELIIAVNDNDPTNNSGILKIEIYY